MTIAVGARILADDIEDLAVVTGAIIARYRRTTNSSTSNSTTRVAVMRIDDVPIRSGRVYEIATCSLQIDGATNNDTLVVEILHTTDGSTPSTSSTLLPGAAGEFLQPNAASPVWGQIRVTYTPGSDQTLSLLLTIKHGVGTGAMGLLANGTASVTEMMIIDRGVDPGSSGTNL